MGFTPYCPACGSVKVKRTKNDRSRMRCLEPDCGHEGKRKKFVADFYVFKPEQRHRRDPIALTPGGYDDNG